MAHYDVCLFGGSGYLGTHMSDAMVRRGRSVLIIDKVAPRVDTGADYRLDGGGDHCEEFWLLACPRNKIGSWNLILAQGALLDGMHAARMLWAKRCYYISSMSVWDYPENSYAVFKSMAEVVVRQDGYTTWYVRRLPTLLGAKEGLVYRADLGLHRAAERQARAGECALSTVARCVWPIELVVSHLVDPSNHDLKDTDLAIHSGAVRYCDIYPRSLVLTDNGGYSTSISDNMKAGDRKVCTKAFRDLVKLIKANAVTPC